MLPEGTVMIEFNEILETNKMIDEEKLDVRTITMGISLLECADTDIGKFNDKIYDRITGLAENLVKTGEEIEKEYGIEVFEKTKKKNRNYWLSMNRCA